MRVGILSLVHESNTFAVTPTTIDLFQRDGLFTGEAVREEFAGGLHQITGFMDGLDETGIEAVPVFYASTSPSGTITRSTCDELIERMFAALDEAGPLDGFLVSPHGANAGEGDDYRDLDGFWLTKLRDHVCTKLIRVNTSGATAADMRTFDYTYRRRPMYPFEELEG